MQSCTAFVSPSTLNYLNFSFVQYNTIGLQSCYRRRLCRSAWVECSSDCPQHNSTRRMAIANRTCVSFCNQPKAHFCLPWVRPLDNRGKCHMDEKRIQCLSNASQHVPIYLQPFTSYSEILVVNCYFFLPHCMLAPSGGVPIGIPGKSLVLRKLESWG